MNKKVVIACIIAFLIVIAGLFYISAYTKAQSEIPYINSNLQSANNNYNDVVSDINNTRYSEALQKSNDTLNDYTEAKTHAQKALNKSQKVNDTILVQYFNYTIDEINMKINATYEIRSGINLLNPNDLSVSQQHFDTSNKLMHDATQYSDKRNQLEKQYPDKFKR